MTQTELAQRRLLEALAELETTTDGGLPGLRLGLTEGVAECMRIGQFAQANVWRRLDDLAAAVHADITDGVAHD